MSTCISFCKLLPENPTNHEDSRNSKEIQGVGSTLDFSRNFLNLQGLLDFLVKAWWYWPLEYSSISMKFQAYS